jgi:AcrR family transcriptional regulator
VVSAVDDRRDGTRRRLIEVAAQILEREGVQGLSTRSVAAAAGIRAASLYQLFGDKEGLLTALAVHAFDTYLAEKHALTPSGDPVADMRRGWDTHVEFGLRHPALYLLMYGTIRPSRRPPAAEKARDLLVDFLDRTAAAGRLTLPSSLAADLLLAAVTGVTLALISTPAPDRNPEISTRTRDALVDTITTDPSPTSDPGLAARALALDAVLPAPDDPLRATELALLRDWLHRLAN